MWIILFIIFIGIPIMKELIEDASYREECRRRGWDTYIDVGGTWRYTDTNKKVK